MCQKQPERIKEEEQRTDPESAKQKQTKPEVKSIRLNRHYGRFVYAKHIIQFSNRADIMSTEFASVRSGDIDYYHFHDGLL